MISFDNQAVKIRQKVSINKEWQFTTDKIESVNANLDNRSWRLVNLPHTWNAEDAFDDQPGYRQGAGWYRKTLKLGKEMRGKCLSLYFEAANQTAEVFVNGKSAGTHVGGYTGFSIDFTDLAIFDEKESPNVIVVRVDNSNNPDVPPSPTADFNFYGGIYRDVWLVATDYVHITTGDYAGLGVYIDAAISSAESATVSVRAKIDNKTFVAKKVRVVNTVFDAEDRRVTSSESELLVAANQRTTFEQKTALISNPRLWSPESPYLYKVRTQVFEGKRLTDEVENPLGFRWYSFDADKGFFLNGRSYKLRGANRHQDYQGRGNAVPDDLQIKDLRLIKEAGFNWLLLAHYPHDPSVLKAADEIGLLVWEEIPVLRQINLTPAFTRNAKNMLIEMIRQHYNHPSVVMWCYMNEIFLRMRPETNYPEKVAELARELETTARVEDPGRLTVISINRPYSDKNPYESSRLLDIPQVVAFHLYFGWYYGEPKDLGGFLDEQHRLYPNRKLLISEYGADSNGRLHTFSPAKKDYSSEWARRLHQTYVRELEVRPFVGGYGVWNMFDFGSEVRGESLPRVNTKGLMTFDRQPKDVYYFYQASFSKSPVLRIATREWARRLNPPAAANGSGQNVSPAHPIEIYSNLPEVELYLNGKSQGFKQIDSQRSAIWNISLQTGKNTLTARGKIGSKIVTDETEIEVIEAPADLSSVAGDFELSIDVGATTQFTDSNGRLWSPDQPYAKGGWGYVGGSATRTDEDVLETADDPLFQTLRQGVREYRFDVTEGEYEVHLGMVEPVISKLNERIMTIKVNDRILLNNLDLFRESNQLRAFEKTFKVLVKTGEGLTLNFEPVKGETLLSFVRVKKLR